MSMNSEFPPIDNSKKENLEFSQDNFTSYLIDYREGLWLSIRQKENGVWQFIAFFAGAIVLLTSLFDIGNQSFTFLSVALISIIVLLVSSWGILIILDANYWQNRNLWIISNIEVKILKERNELGKLIPKNYATPNFRYTNSYTFHIYLLFIISNFIMLGNLIFINNLGNNIGIQDLLVSAILIIISCGLMLFINEKDVSWVNVYYQDRSKMPGDRTDFVDYPVFYGYKNFINSPLLLWSYVLTMVDLCFGLTIITRYYNFVIPQYVNSIVIGLIIIGFIILLIIKKMLKRTIKILDKETDKKIAEKEFLGLNEARHLSRSFSIITWTIRAINYISVFLSTIILVLYFLFQRGIG